MQRFTIMAWPVLATIHLPLRSGLCAERSTLSGGGAERDGFAAIGGGEMAEPRERRDHEPRALLDLLALREMARDLFDGSAAPWPLRARASPQPSPPVPRQSGICASSPVKPPRTGTPLALARACPLPVSCGGARPQGAPSRRRNRSAGSGNPGAASGPCRSSPAMERCWLSATSLEDLLVQKHRRPAIGLEDERIEPLMELLQDEYEALVLDALVPAPKASHAFSFRARYTFA